MNMPFFLKVANGFNGLNANIYKAYTVTNFKITREITYLLNYQVTYKITQPFQILSGTKKESSFYFT